ncbi:MAG TPA: anaerobic sulfatase maturase [Casimicrobiaceae bacterium]|nr:anaerobic sulfatase maturase [Casimicrobiaceae bacterium]
MTAGAAGAGDAPPDKYHVPQWLGDRAVRRFHAMAKPAGATCNLDCTYCFYLSKHDLPGGPGRGAMSDEVLERFVRDYIASVTADEVVFTWQGGEPTLRGLAFFERVVALQRRHAKPGQRIENDLQTNGVLLDDAWARFLKAHHFLVGLSIDGPQDVHDAMRIARGGKPTFDAVMAAAQLLKRHGVPFNTLTCVHRANATRPLDVYRFLRRELGSTRLQFIPIVEPKDFRVTSPQARDASRLPFAGSPQARPGDPASIVTDWSVDPDEYGYFLCKVWDEWLRRDVGKALVNFCETLVVQHMGEPAQVCVYAETCGKGVVVEHDGGVYSCDHYVYPEHLLGNVRTQSLADMVFSPRQVKFGYDKSDALPAYCRTCAFLPDCWGECPKNRFVRAPDGEPGLNYLCPGLRRFFAHASPQAERMAAASRAARFRGAGGR